MRSLPRSLIWRTFLANVAVIGVAVVLLIVTPVTISSPIAAAELAILLAGAAALVVTNWILVTRTMAPLRELVDETSRAVLAGQEGERRRVARELHDEVGQSLIAIALEAERAAAEAPPELAAKLRKIAAGLHFNLDELRRIAHELRPEMLDDLGLLNALAALANSVRAHAELRVERDLPAEMPPLSEELDLVLYRVAQEALTNAARHSGAERARLELRREGNEMVLAVSDDGSGFDPDAEAGVGLRGMRERARLVGGTLAVESERGEGTIVTLRVPAGAEA